MYFFFLFYIYNIIFKIFNTLKINNYVLIQRYHCIPELIGRFVICKIINKYRIVVSIINSSHTNNS